MFLLLIFLQLTCTQKLQEQRSHYESKPVPKKISEMIQYLYSDRSAIQLINQYDQQILSTWLDQLQLTQITPKEIEQLTTSKKSILFRKMLTINRYLKKHYRTRKGSTIRWKTYSFLGPFLESYRVLCDLNDLDDRDIWRKALYKKCHFNQKLFQTDIKTQLLTLAKKGDGVLLDKQNRLTPFVAKMILSLWIEDHLKKKPQLRRQFLNSILHKTNYSEMLCGGFCNYSRHRFSKNLDLMVPHMGYQLLNSFHNRDYTKTIAVILKNKELSELGKGILVGAGGVPLKTTGIECSLWLQQGLNHMRLYHSSQRMKSMLMRDQLKDHFQRIELRHESQIQSGDIVQLKGHTFMFLGYRKIDGIYRLVTLEATGGSVRSVGLFYRSLPYEFDPSIRCGYPNYYRSEKQWKKKHHRARWYLFRFKEKQ